MKFPKLAGKVLLAPMAGITNLAFRLICREYGAAAVMTEMISAEALVRNSPATRKIAMTDDSEKPVGLQLFGSDILRMKKAAIMVQDKFNFIDINMGCSVQKIIGQKAGAYLMKNPEDAGKLIKGLSKAVDIPITIKIRLGFNNVNAVEIGVIAEENGASAITVHPRKSNVGFSGLSDWEIIKQVKKSVSIPVIGNGDIWKPEDAKRMLKQTGCDYVMIGRAAIGNPFIFRQVNEYLKGNIVMQTHGEKKEDFLRYIDYCRRFKIVSFNDIREKAMHFTKSVPGSAKMRQEIGKTKNIPQIEKLVNGFKSHQD